MNVVMGEQGGTIPSWSSLGIEQALITHLERLGYDRPTELQQLLVPAISNERDILIEAPRGTGRTLAIAIATTELVADCDPGEAAVALILSSSDQRCSAIARDLQRCGAGIRRSGHEGIRTAVVSELGSSPAQARELEKPLDVVIGTPGRLDHLASNEQLALDSFEMVVVDDADALAIGDESMALTNVLDSVEPDRQRVILAGALLGPLVDLIGSRLNDPDRPRPTVAEPVPDGLPQRAFSVTNPTPEHVATLSTLLGSPVNVLVSPRERETFEQFAKQSSTALTVSSIADPPSFTQGSALICTHLPTSTGKYARLVQAATAAGCSELVLLAAPSHRHLLRALGKVGGAHLNAAPFPTEHAVETRQTMKLEDLVTDHLSKVSSQPTPRFLASVHRLSAEYDVADIAAAAMELAHQALQREIEPGQDIPLLLRQTSPTRSNDRRQGGVASPDSGAQRRKGGDRRGKEVEPGMTRLFVAAGYNYGVRPGDIVGAFAGESGLSGKEIGNIDIRESFTLVEVPEKLADDVIDAMVDGTIKGRQIEVRRERY